MRKSRQEAAKTRERITATGLADFMKAAGLTHGGFYRHFNSKDQLVAKACATAAATMTARVAASASNGREGDGSGAAVADYLSAKHRDNADGVAFFKQMPHRVAPRLAGLRLSRKPAGSFIFALFTSHVDYRRHLIIDGVNHLNVNRGIAVVQKNLEEKIRDNEEIEKPGGRDSAAHYRH